MPRKKRKPPINETLKSARLAAGLNQKEAGKLVGIPQSEVSRMESGKGAATAVKWLRYAKAVGFERIDELAD